MSRTSRTGALAFAALLLAPAAARAEFEAPRPSPKETLTQRIGLTDVIISYSRPSVKGRVIWGELVPWDKPWRTGANEATTITFMDDVTVDGQKLAAGTYSIVTIPGKAEWTVIFSKDTKLWFVTEYSEANDVLRVKAKPQASEMVETLRIGFPTVGPASAVLAIEWEKLRVPVTIGVEVDGKVRAAVASAKADDWQTPLAAATYFFGQKKDAATAWSWLEKSISIQENYQNVARKARVLADEGKTAEAVKAGEAAIALAKTSPDKPNMTGFEKALAEWKAKVK